MKARDEVLSNPTAVVKEVVKGNLNWSVIDCSSCAKRCWQWSTFHSKLTTTHTVIVGQALGPEG